MHARKPTETRRPPRRDRDVELARLERGLSRVVDDATARRSSASRELAAYRKQERLLDAAVSLRAPAVTQRILAWVKRLHKDGIANRVGRIQRRVGILYRSVEILGSVDADGRDRADGVVGNYWASIDLDRPAVHVSTWHSATQWGHRTYTILTPRSRVCVPVGVLIRIDRDIESGAAWRHIRRTLGVALRRFRKDLEMAIKDELAGGANVVASLRASLKRLGAATMTPDKKCAADRKNTTSRRRGV